MYPGLTDTRSVPNIDVNIYERNGVAMSMTAIDLPKVSADAHVNEPHDLWWTRLPDDLREAAPHRIQANEEGGWSLVVNGEVDLSGSDPLNLQQARQDEDALREAQASVATRLAMMRADGINAEIVFPTIGLYVYGVADPQVGIVSCQVYNDWIREKLGEESPRIRYAALIPAWDAASAITEIQRVASWQNVGGLMLPLVGTPEWNMPEWEPLWSAIEETGLPAVMHQGTGHSMIFYKGWGSPTANLLTTQSMAPRAAALLSCSGVLERYPDLHVVMVEVNAGWMSWVMSTLDEYFVAHGAGLRKPHLPEMPSHYLRRQVHATFQSDPVAVMMRSFTGTDCLLWGNDFPHGEGTYPHSNKVLDELLHDVSYEDARKIVGGNALRLFGFDRAVLESRP
jgi:predicted TIM-barrel fold metal-dependent hydrolase